ncbi:MULTISPECIES: glycoside hydrolase family 25 protein [Chryseobacterium]|jgi:lysozyme|uniref:Glycoside hydrolase family 25 protein n=1 Tax=Chryseobacterium rhizosphaerae TaxID=395937 RepID=A0AAE4C3A6_9FLAO|nr:MULTISPECIES: GH25 family lysozyme [Chryseobacterium]MBL3549253.1 glycoside hydrolase family 25 protein [Chryseobacterium sp. KMC2]MDR6527403.1 lysozyme [Chryseobacterium rhizosphaerae]MDR6547457.1 lysozyme [Chryseobacterium rhizosphaerae]REC71641.1 glycoside hydrolase family 25 protein [Chryseobacterium rhizosphaerae]SMC50664.1 lysozyme [Chryseobacterium sp. YR221]
MTPKKYTKKTAKQLHINRRKNYFFRRKVVLAILIIALIGTGFYLKQSVSYYYALYFNKFSHKKLHNSERETLRIQKILTDNLDKTYGFDVSHYQNREDIKWDSLSIGNKTIPLEFVIMRATMGNRNADKHFEEFWGKAQKHNLIRGAYHFYRADEDPIIQANNFLANVKLESGDLPPILDIEKIPKRKTNKKLIEDLKIWCKIIEDTYGEKPIIYTYYHYYKDFLKGEFDGYPLWLANYNDVPSPSPDDQWDFWQFTENGIVHGINTKVDLNIYNGNSWSLKRLTID